MRTFAQIVNALGQPQALRRIGIPNGSGAQAAIARWRHQGAVIDLSGADTYQLVFNISGGQVVELRSRENTVRHAVRAGSIAVVCPGDSECVKISGEADTLQFFLPRELIEPVGGGLSPSAPPQLLLCTARLQATAAQALVALSQSGDGGTSALESIVTDIAGQFTQPNELPAGLRRGGLSPAARRRVDALIDGRFNEAPYSSLPLAELAAAAGLSVHHFIKAFRRSEGATPYARVITRRIDKALALLLRADARVDEIADETGFSSPAHFVSTFRKHVGVTPGALRNAAYSLDRT